MKFNPEYWGRAAAGILPMAKSTRRFLIPLRSEEVMEPGTFGTIGGKIDGREHPEETAVREFYEETGYDGNIELYTLYVYKDGSFRYHNFLGIIADEFDPDTNWETDDWVWVDLRGLLSLEPKHFGLEELLSDREALLTLRYHAK